jgi:hypothetical protein
LVKSASFGGLAGCVVELVYYAWHSSGGAARTSVRATMWARNLSQRHLSTLRRAHRHCPRLCALDALPWSPASRIGASKPFVPLGTFDFCKPHSNRPMDSAIVIVNLVWRDVSVPLRSVCNKVTPYHFLYGSIEALDDGCLLHTLACKVMNALLAKDRADLPVEAPFALVGLRLLRLPWRARRSSARMALSICFTSLLLTGMIQANLLSTSMQVSR